MGSSRRLGLLNDGVVVPTLPRFELERLEAPTLIISALCHPERSAPKARVAKDLLLGRSEGPPKQVLRALALRANGAQDDKALASMKRKE